MALGDYSHTSAELYTFETDEWKIVPPYPLHDNLTDMGLIALDNSFYAFGGFWSTDDVFTQHIPVNDIVRFSLDTNQWTRLGQVSRARNSPGVAVINNEFYIVGGMDDWLWINPWDNTLPTEKCTLVSDTI